MKPARRAFDFGCLHWLGLTLLVIVADLYTKQLAQSQLDYAVPVTLLPVLDLTLLHNTGAAFSFLSEASGWQRWFFIVVTLAISGLLLVWLKRTARQQWWLGAALALILGGALGNLYDRVTLGYVVDFISVHYQQYYFPAFNLADSAITLGAVVMIIDMLFFENDDSESSANPQEH